MRVMVLGASGHIGQKLVQDLCAAPWAATAAASRSISASAHSDKVELIQINTLDEAALTTVLGRFDAIVNCVAGNANSISTGAKAIASAALAAGCPRVIHLSTMSVYGPAQGKLLESAPLDPGLGWYGRAKCEAEIYLKQYAHRGGQVVVLRPGCVFGPGSELWVGRIGRWLSSARLGDLGIAGDGWSNLVHVDDVSLAVLRALQMPAYGGEFKAFNLAAPDSPRWNQYFVDLAVAIGAVPVRRISSIQIGLDSLLAGPPLKIAEAACRILHGGRAFVPDPMPPGLVRLWAQHIQLDSTLATGQLQLKWTPYDAGVKSSAAWFSRGSR